MCGSRFGTEDFPLRPATIASNGIGTMKNLKSALLLASVVATVLSSSCATSRGFGKDLQKVGDKIETTADETGGAR